MSKRPNGDGTVRQRRPGLWEARLTVGTRGGRQVRRSLYAPTEREAWRRLEEARRNLAIGVVEAGPRLRTAEYLRDWLEVTRQLVKPRTWTRYGQLVELQLIPQLGDVPLVKLSPGHVERALANLVDGGLSARSASHARAALRTALNRAVKHGLLARNAAALAEPPRVPRSRRRTLSPDELRLLLPAIRGDRLEALYLVALSTSLRESEVLGLRWDDVDWTQGSLESSAQLQRVRGELRLVTTKTDDVRTIGVPRSVLAVLKSWRARQAEERLRAGADWGDPDGLIFTRPLGQPLYLTLVWRAWHDVLKRAGIESVPFHTLRHSAASLLLAQGVDLKVVQRVLGHRNIATTADTYTHVLPELMRDAAERMDALLEELGS